MLFLEWLLDQRYEGKFSALADLVWTDIQNGCLEPIKSVIELQDHYRDRHGHISTRMNGLIAEAFGAYTERLKR